MTDEASHPSPESAGTPDDTTSPEPGAPAAGAEEAAGSDFWVEDDHDETGLDLAKSISRAMAGSASSLPKRRRTPMKRRRRVVPKASGAHPDERDPQTLDTTLGRLVSDHGWALDLRMHAVFGRWPELVGEDVAQHCTPTGFNDGRLTVRTDSTAWATQLRLLAPTVVRRLNEEVGHGTVTVIDIEGPHLPTWRAGRLSVRDGRGPRDTYG